ncbi:MAG: N-acetylmuramoyl-L-alanine amidase [Bacillota bacterium]|nr:N-acetylmuramoyl-L-alanine amidase [Bacillota bacterium]
MPTLFLSPSTQQYNEYILEGREEEQTMNELADALQPYLYAMGIDFARNDPALTVGGSVASSNAGDFELHLALHSNAAGDASSGQIRGVDVFYYPGSIEGERAANLLAGAIANIYPLPERVAASPNIGLYELRMTEAPAVLMEIGYHDNYADAVWLTENIPAIAEAIALALSQYYDIQFVSP